MGAQMLGHALDAVDIGAGKYYARHPSMEQQAAITDALLDARQATVACDRAIVVEDKVLARKRCDEAVASYSSLYNLLDATGVLSGRCVDCGGAETDMPRPGPLPLPKPGEIREAMDGR